MLTIRDLQRICTTERNDHPGRRDTRNFAEPNNGFHYSTWNGNRHVLKYHAYRVEHNNGRPIRTK